MYARIENIAHKSDDDLKALKAAGVNDLYIGIESGLTDILDYLNKAIPSKKSEGSVCASTPSASAIQIY